MDFKYALKASFYALKNENMQNKTTNFTLTYELEHIFLM